MVLQYLAHTSRDSCMRGHNPVYYLLYWLFFVFLVTSQEVDGMVEVEFLFKHCYFIGLFLCSMIFVFSNQSRS